MQDKRTILCDVAGLLLLYDYPKFLQELAERGVKVPSPESDFIYETKGFKNFQRGAITEQEFYEYVLKYLGADLSFGVVKRLFTDEFYGLDADFVEYAKQMAERYNFAFVTDTNTWQNQRERELVDLTRIVRQERIHRSNEGGYVKTDPQFFPLVLRSLDRSGEDCILLDDNQDNLKRAQEYGITPVHYQGQLWLLKTELEKIGIKI